MRGKVDAFNATYSDGGIIPAHAGKRYFSQRIEYGRGDHPRSCGEKSLLVCPLATILGSSPLMRGKVPDKLERCLEWGIIPAHAGKRDKWPGWYPLPEGSSPLMRGKGLSFAISSREYRIIPAHAGKRTLRICILTAPRDHPRSCGEKCKCG